MLVYEMGQSDVIAEPKKKKHHNEFFLAIYVQAGRFPSDLKMSDMHVVLAFVPCGAIRRLRAVSSFLRDAMSAMSAM